MNRKYVVFGFLSPLSAFIFINISIYVHNFEFTGNALSDMGRVGLEKNYIFNTGLILSGICGILFSLGIYHGVKKYEKISALILALASIFLICIGVFPEGTDPHGFFSVGFYLLGFIALILFGVFILRRKRNIGIFSVGSAILGLVLALVPDWNGVAIPETIGAFFICLWMVVVAYTLWRNRL